jgi:hypothetical protein
MALSLDRCEPTSWRDRMQDLLAPHCTAFPLAFRREMVSSSRREAFPYHSDLF